MTPTAHLAYVVSRAGDSAATAKRRLDLQRPNIAVLLRYGAWIAIGSDRVSHTAREEFDAMRSLGLMSNAELLRLWAEATPQAIFPRRSIGRLVEGYEASFLVLRADPLSKI